MLRSSGSTAGHRVRKPDRGVVKLRISVLSQHDATVTSHLDTLIVQRRL